jgi:hypothetical protein
MKTKFLSIVLSFFLIFAFAGISIAGHNQGCPENNPNCNQQGGGDVDIDNNIGNATTLFGDAKTFSPEANATAKGGDGGDATVRNSGNSNNENTNVAIGKGGTAIQGQKMKQGQSMKSKNVNNISIEGDTTNVEADKREHITGPGLLKGDAKVVDTKASNARALGGLFEHVDFLTMKQAKMASKNASDMDVEPALIMENDFQTTTINIGKADQFAGHIYIFSDGSDSYLSAMDAEASETAMKAGLTHIRRLDSVETSKHLEGSAWNLGIGGGASIMSSGEDLALAPNGGAGYGKAKSSSQMRPDAVYEVSFAEGMIKDLQKAKSTTKYTYTVADK